MYINPDIFSFLLALKRNNNKEWFDKNRERYTLLRENFMQFTNLLLSEIVSFDESLKNIVARDCIFRINKDIRFSADKRPYKNNFGAEFSRGGRRSAYASYYVHIEPGRCFAGGGLYMPMPPVLKAVRKEIYENIEEFEEILQNTQFKKTFGELEEIDMLKTAPSGFPKDFRRMEILRHKHYIVSFSVDDNMVCSKSFLPMLVKKFRILFPFNSFLNNAIDIANTT